jgi:hypothetical protein
MSDSNSKLAAGGLLVRSYFVRSLRSLPYGRSCWFYQLPSHVQSDCGLPYTHTPLYVASTTPHKGMPLTQVRDHQFISS